MGGTTGRATHLATTRSARDRSDQGSTFGGFYSRLSKDGEIGGEKT